MTIRRRADSQGINHCKELTALITSSNKYEIITAPSLTLIVFRLNPKWGDGTRMDDSELNLLNQELHTRLDKRSDVFLTPTMLHSSSPSSPSSSSHSSPSIYCFRFAMGGLRTCWEDVASVWDVLEGEGESLLAQRGIRG